MDIHSPTVQQEFSFCSKNELTYTFYVGPNKTWFKDSAFSNCGKSL